MMKNQITSKELKLLELEIAKAVKKVCDENNIDYFIIGGTLLGAVRHKGFIPWDDDMDIGMTTNNYEKFIEVAKSKLDERFFIQTSQTDPNYYNVFAKVRLRHTHMFEKVTEDLGIEDGIFVDIFPYDSIAENLLQKKGYMLKIRVLGKISLLKHGYNLNGITDNKAGKIINLFAKYLPISVKRVDEKLQSILPSNLCGNSGEYYIERDGMFRGNFVFPKEYFDELIELPFENTRFKAPKYFKEYLSKAYGNYMEYPPEAEREKGHSVSNIILENEFNTYFK